MDWLFIGAGVVVIIWGIVLLWRFKKEDLKELYALTTKKIQLPKSK